MGLFHKKKADQKASKKGITNPQQFYTDCVAVYHNRAKELGFAERGVIFIPELIPLGEKAVLLFLKDPYIQQQIPDPFDYYSVALNTAIRCGILFGAKWHTDLSELEKPGYIESVIESSPVSLTRDLIKSELGLDDKSYKDFSYKIFEKWVEMHKPYWELNDPRQYTVNATVAAFQLGVSMILCKYGF